MHKSRNTRKRMMALGLATSITVSVGVQPVYATDQPEPLQVEASAIQESLVANEVVMFSDVMDREASSDYLFLSDLSHVEDMLSIGYGSFQLDKNPGGSTITLLMDDKRVQFEKGLGAHAPSNVVYDLTGYEDYTRFTTYVGVDYSMSNRGNGVIFQIQVSNDGKTWTELARSPIQKGNTEAYYMDVDVSGYKYLKLHANHNGNNGSDHAVYGYPRLIKEDYYTDMDKDIQFKTVAAYDEEIKSYGLATDVATYQNVLYQRTFVKEANYDMLALLGQTSGKTKAAIDWLMTDEEALAYYITGGAPDASHTVALKVLGDLYHEVKADFSDVAEGAFYKRLAISVALTSTSHTATRVERYHTFKNLYTQNKLMDKNQFKNLPVETLRQVVGNDNDGSWVKADNAHINWLNDYVRGFDPTAPIGSINPYTYITYRSGYNHRAEKYYNEEKYAKWNEKYRLEAYNIPYGDTNYVPQWVIFEEGAVCGGISGAGVSLHTAVGIPTAFVGQPGHAAYLIYQENEAGEGIWTIGNNISGFPQTNRGGRLPLGWGSGSWSTGYKGSYYLLSQHALNDYDTYIEALNLIHLADVYKGDNLAQQELYTRTLSIQPYNVDAMVGLLNTYKADETKTMEDYVALAEQFGEALTYFPLPMMDMLNLIKQQVTDPIALYTIDLLKSQNFVLATQADQSVSLQPGDCRAIANYLLGGNKVSLASFSFDGEMANQLVIDPRLAELGVGIHYSLDGGESWIETTAYTIVLEEEALAMLSADNDILVRVAGITSVYTIDLTPGTSLQGKKIYQNDWENQFVGEIEGLEYSEDNGITWYTYVSGAQGPRFNQENQQVMLRMRRSGTQLEGEASIYTFTADQSSPSNSYITIDRLSVADYSSQQDNHSQAAVNVVDGNIHTIWHSIYDRSDAQRYVTIAIDEPTYISQIQYVPRGNAGNGTITKANIYVSMDNENWTTVAEGVSWPRNATVKTYQLDKPILAKYVKVQGAEAYGNYCSALMINLYEDTKPSGIEPVLIGVEDVALQVGDSFDPLGGIRAIDEEDGDITASIQVEGLELLDLTKAGTYTLTYRVTDSHGNEAVATRVVTVKSVVVLDGLNALLVEAQSRVEKGQGVVADDVWENLLEMIVWGNEIVADKNALPSEVYSITLHLQQAIAQVDAAVDASYRKPLKEALDNAEGVLATGQGLVEDIVWEELVELVAIGYEVYNDPQATPQEMVSMPMFIQLAIADVHASRETEMQQRQPLLDAILEGEHAIAQGQGEIAQIRWDELLEMVAVGHEVYEDRYAPKTEITGMIYHIQAAIKNLNK